MHHSTTFSDSMNNILDKHAPFKKIAKYKLKFRTKPCITPALQKSISIKNKIFKNYIKKKDTTQKMNFITIIKSTEISSLH